MEIDVTNWHSRTSIQTATKSFSTDCDNIHFIFEVEELKRSVHLLGTVTETKLRHGCKKHITKKEFIGHLKFGLWTSSSIGA